MNNINKDLIKENIKKALEQYCQIDGNNVGGSLHIVLDDENTDVNSIKYCADCALQNGDLLGWQIAQWMLLFDERELCKILSIPYTGDLNFEATANQ